MWQRKSWIPASAGMTAVKQGAGISQKFPLARVFAAAKPRAKTVTAGNLPIANRKSQIEN
ncbi:MAG: hypothetical protein E3J72_13755 [Planctomycetota bacterium]|nr:MAG: hypothetical protein E3J72_13755 [Planctomycetota bacterium]